MQGSSSNNDWFLLIRLLCLCHAHVHVQELAWASYALLLNTNICGLAVFWQGQAMLARGLLATPSGVEGSAGQAALLDALGSGPEGWQQATAGQPLHCPDRAAIAKAGAASWASVPEGADSLLAQPLLCFGQADGSPQGLLLLLSERPRALSSKERAWAAAVAAKLCSALGQSQQQKSA